MRIFNFLVIKLTLCLILGILLAYYLEMVVEHVLGLSCLFVTLIFISHKALSRQFYKKIWFGLLIYITFITLGAFTFTLHEQRNFKNHYTKITLTNSEDIVPITFRIKELLKPSKYQYKFVIDITHVDQQEVSGISLLNIEKDTLGHAFIVDQIYVVRSTFNHIQPPLNPYQFDYKNYLKKKYIYHQINTTRDNLFMVSSKKHTVSGFSARFREHINKSLASHNFHVDQLAIINALFLGQRQDISTEMYDNYTRAGAVHILAISGLHVGIVLMLLNLILKPLETIRKGRLIKTILLVIFLWTFAIIAGMSASVVRAVFMFTIIAIAINLSRPTNIFNTISVSIFWLLLLKPNFLFDVGFQLSYMAVISIVSFQPTIAKLLSLKWRVLDYYWKLFTVTVAVQIGILPLSLFYFHQFPGLFLISNLVIIPFLGILLGLGFIAIVLAAFNILPALLASLFGGIINLLNNFITWIGTKESFILTNITFNLDDVLLYYFMVVIAIYIYLNRNHKAIFLSLFSILACQLFLFSQKYYDDNTLVIFHKTRHSIVGIVRQNSLIILTQDKDSTVLLDRSIVNYQIKKGHKHMFLDTIPSVFQFNNTRFLVIDSLGVYNVKSFKPEIVLLTNSPKINLNRLIDSLQPKLIISDGSNYRSYQDRWELTCMNKKIPFHQTSKKGAFIYSY